MPKKKTAKPPKRQTPKPPAARTPGRAAGAAAGRRATPAAGGAALDFDEIDGADLIQDTFLFKRLNFGESASLAAEFSRRAYGPGEAIIEQDSIGEALYLIRTGTVHVIRTDGGVQQRLAELGAGQIVGEMSLIESELTSASVVAASDVECLVLPKKSLDRLMSQSQALSAKIYQAFCFALSDRLRRANNAMLQLRRTVGH